MSGINYNVLGLSILDNFITEEEESFILSHIKECPVRSHKHRNSIKRYGSDLPYRSNMISDVIPEHLDIIGEKVFNSGILKTKPNSISINEYFPSQQITPHIDSPSSGDVIVVLSLLSDAIMKFSFKEKTFSVELKRRSLVVMKNEIRTRWMHSILPVENKRYSIVFRCGKEK